jgi:hypothetical protein
LAKLKPQILPETGMTVRNRKAATGVSRMPIRIGTVPVTLAVVLIAGGFHRAAADDNPFGSPTRKNIEQSQREETPSKKAQRIEFNKRVRVLKKGMSSRASRRAALGLMPLDKLKDSQQERAVAILRSASMFRELPLLECDVEPEVYNYFARQPDAAVSIWRAMKISVFQMSQTDPTSYDVNSGDGTTGKVEVLYQTDEECLVICTGLFKNPLILKPISATGLFHLQTTMKRRKDGTSVATHQGRMFVAFPSQAVSTVAKVISPISNVIIDRNFREVSLFLHMMSMAMQRQPGWVEHISKKMDGVPAERRVELLRLTAEMYVDARKRKLAATGQPADDIDVDIDTLFPRIVEPKNEGRKPTTPRVVSKPMRTAN